MAPKVRQPDDQSMTISEPRIAPTSRGRIEYRISGTGPVVVILRGGHSSRTTRLGHERLVGEGFAVLEPSRPGYDGTPVKVGCTAQDAADALAQLLDVLHIERASLVAISAAGHTGIELARRHPERIERVSFESAVALPWEGLIRHGGRVLFGPPQALVWAAVRAGLRVAPSAMLRFQLGQITTLDAARLVRDMDAATRRQYVDVYRSLWSGRGFRCDLGHESPSGEPLAQPALIMRGVHDPSVPAAHAARLRALFPRHENIEVNAESHLIWLGRSADEVWRRRLSFLRQPFG
jgi:pimeloyl-ACP methyl ester carboxylesterase